MSIQTDIKTAKKYAKRLQAKYIIQEFEYKTIGASKEALRKNAERRALSDEFMRLMCRLERKYS